MIFSENEWAPLKKVIIGTATNAHWPVNCKTFRGQEKTSQWTNTPLPSGPVDSGVVAEANEGLDQFAHSLIQMGIDVQRPRNLNFQKFDGMYNYCPRDRLLIVGDKVIDAPMRYPTRKKEIESMQHIFNTEIITCDDPEVVFDAANICRLGKHLLYLVSDSGNIAGAKWLQKILGCSYKVHIIDNIYSGFHIDSTISPLHEGLVVLNGDRVNKHNVPSPLKKWTKIFITSRDIVPRSFVHYPYASNYIALNFLVIDPLTVVCDPTQKHLIACLHEHNIDYIGIDLKHSRTLGGGHHCVSLDLERES